MAAVLTPHRSSVSFAQRVFGLSDDAMSVLRGEDGTLNRSSTHDVLHAMKPAMMGPNLYRMNVRALSNVSTLLNGIGPEGLHVSNVYLWLRDVMTMATMEGLYGKANPMRQDPTLIDSLW